MRNQPRFGVKFDKFDGWLDKRFAKKSSITRKRVQETWPTLIDIECFNHAVSFSRTPVTESLEDKRKTLELPRRFRASNFRNLIFDLHRFR